MAKGESEHEMSADGGDVDAQPSDVKHATFIVRTSETASGRMVGVVEHVKTGRKERFDGLEALSSAIAALTRVLPPK